MPVAFLVGMSEAIKGQKFEIKRDRTTMGRNPNNAIVLDDVAVSSQHCYISIRGGRYILHDLNSTNGTRLNSQPITEAELKPKQVLQIGSLELMFNEESSDAPLATTSINTEVVIDNAPAVAKPQSFSRVSPLGRHSQEEKASWLVIIIIAAALALVGFVMFMYKLLW